MEARYSVQHFEEEVRMPEEILVVKSREEIGANPANLSAKHDRRKKYPKSVASLTSADPSKKYKGPFVRPFFRPPGR